MKYSKEQYESIINEVYPGVKMYVRDLDLDESLAAKYKTGMIILEKGFTDASRRVMGMSTTYRYTILSNHMVDMSEYEEDTNWGLCIAKNGSHFKILDIYEYNGKKQILLLHLPNDFRWRMFKNLSVNIEEDIIEDCRKRFEDACMSEVAPELDTKEWKERCEFPLGMTDNGDFFDTDVTIESIMKTIKDVNFRNLYHKLIFIQSSNILDTFREHLDLSGDETGAVAYGYIDEQNGMSFQILGTACITQDDELKIKSISSEHDLVVRREAIVEDKYVNLEEIRLGVPDYSTIIDSINLTYDTKNEIKEKMRCMDFLDEFRNENFPDDVAVILPPREGKRPERVWINCNNITEDALYGILLNEPQQDMGVHKDDVVKFVPMENEKKNMVLVAL